MRPTDAFRETRSGLVTVSTSLFAILAYMGCLDLAYETLIKTVFGSMSSQDALVSGTSFQHVAAYALAIVAGLPLAWLSSRRKGVASTTLILLYLFLIGPLLTMYGDGAADGAYVCAIVAGFLVALVTASGLRFRSPAPLEPRIARLAILGAVVVTAYVYGSLIALGGLGRFNLNFYAVYDVRELSEIDELRVPLLSYLLTWQANVLNSAALLIAIVRRSWFGVLLLVGLQVLLFGLTNYKSFLFAPILVAGVYFATSRPRPFLWLAGSAIVVIAGSYALFRATNEIMIPSVFVRRLFFGPADNHLLYYDFFSRERHPFVMLSNSIFKYFMAYPYRQPVKTLIAAEFFGGIGSPNVGFFGDAYYQFGIAGILSFSMVLGVFLGFVDQLARGTSPAFASALAAAPAMALVNTGFLTALLTHGFLLAAAGIWLLSSVTVRRRVSVPVLGATAVSP